MTAQEQRRSLQLGVMRRGDYGYDAPCFPVIFAFLSVAAGLGAAMSRRQGVVRPAVRMKLHFVFFHGSAGSFLYAARRGKFLEWDRIPRHGVRPRHSAGGGRRDGDGPSDGRRF